MSPPNVPKITGLIDWFLYHTCTWMYVIQCHFFCHLLIRWVWCLYHRVLRECNAGSVHRGDCRRSDRFWILGNNTHPLLLTAGWWRFGAGVWLHPKHLLSNLWSALKELGYHHKQNTAHTLCVVEADVNLWVLKRNITWKTPFSFSRLILSLPHMSRCTQTVSDTFEQTSVWMSGRLLVRRRSYAVLWTSGRWWLLSPEENWSTLRWTR